MACGPRKAAAAHVRAGLLELESRSDGRKKKPRRAGPVRQREERGKGWRRAGPGKGNWAGGGTFGPRGKKKKGEGERRDGPAGLKRGEGCKDIMNA